MVNTAKHRVYDIAKESPLTKARKLSQRLNINTYLKREDLQPVHSFKLRGAYNKMSQLSPEESRRGVIAASAGNHAQGVALSAKMLSMSALIIMPETTPQIKVDAVKSFGAEVILHGDSYSEAADYCKTTIAHTGRTFIHPFDDPLVIAGQGTIGQEIIKQLPSVTHIFVPIGGGGLIAGISQFVKKQHPNIKIIGVEPEDSAAMQQSIAANQRITLKHVGIFADGVAVKQVGELTFDLVKQYVDDLITVTTDQICSAIQDIFEETRNIVEPSGALAVAAINNYFADKSSDDTVHAVAICSGANMSFERLQFVAERTMVGSGIESLFAVKIPEEAGALLRFCDEVINGYSISEFNYRLRERGEAHIFVGVKTNTLQKKRALTDDIRRLGYEYYDLSKDEVVKEHIRHMIGGVAPQASNELLYLVEFPERPGALGEFLRVMQNEWNISLFHYRGQGGDVGRVLIGYECNDQQSIEKRFKQTGIRFEAVNTKGTQLFL